MLPYACPPKTKSYRVEVSGWDCRDHFFVENCDLLWSDESGKHVRLRRRLKNNGIVLVRLLCPSYAEHAHPVVYRAEWLGTAANGMNQFYLRALQPRDGEGEGPAV
jgi:hypothetical protein